MVSLVSRSGRHNQRYDKDKGHRQVAGCIPYRYKKSEQPCSHQDIEILVISAQKGRGMLFPKGGWEEDESMEEAALRETFEEAGVWGHLEHRLGPWKYMSKRGAIMHDAYMFPLLVQQQFDIWPEMNIRKRKWVSVEEAREVCKRGWMRDALDELILSKTQLQHQREQTE